MSRHTPPRFGGCRPLRAFTLTELLVVVAIVSLLAAVLFPVFARAREKARQTTCASNLKQLILAWQMYAQDYDETACPSYVGNDNPAWDFAQVGTIYVPGLLGAYSKDGRVAGCPDWVNKNPAARPVNGYAYNATYLGGDMGTSVFGDIPPAPLSRIARPADTPAFADGAYTNMTGATLPQNYLRAPSDPVLSFWASTVHFRHDGAAQVAYADGHVGVARAAFLPRPQFPAFGTLSLDDSAYGPDMAPACRFAPSPCL